jgi:hypothetical protein
MQCDRVSTRHDRRSAATASVSAFVGGEREGDRRERRPARRGPRVPRRPRRRHCRPFGEPPRLSKPFPRGLCFAGAVICVLRARSMGSSTCPTTAWAAAVFAESRRFFEQPMEGKMTLQLQVVTFLSEGMGCYIS